MGWSTCAFGKTACYLAVHIRSGTVQQVDTRCPVAWYAEVPPGPDGGQPRRLLWWERLRDLSAAWLWEPVQRLLKEVPQVASRATWIAV